MRKFRAKSSRCDMKIDSLDVSSAAELEQIQKIFEDIDHPEGKTGDFEAWLVFRFLNLIANSSLIDFPLTLKPGERPDLVLSSSAGKTRIEITRALHPDLAAIESALENKSVELNQTFTWFPPAIRINENLFYPEEKIVEIVTGKSKGRNAPLTDEMVETYWSEAMIAISERKARSLHETGGSKCDRNWLVIYDNWWPGIEDCQTVVESLSQLLFKAEPEYSHDRIFILAGEGDAVWEFPSPGIYHKHVSNP
ncbi:MAG: hypothetical protein OXH65_02805 [Paracoccaceae bacterium]|nr:hypothetical protein [Paracoccaceae bacterium]